MNRDKIVNKNIKMGNFTSQEEPITIHISGEEYIPDDILDPVPTKERTTTYKTYSETLNVNLRHFDEGLLFLDDSREQVVVGYYED